MSDPRLAIKSEQKKNANSTRFHFADPSGVRLLKSKSDFSQFNALTLEKQNDLKDQFKTVLGIPSGAVVEFEKSTRGVGVVLTNPNNEQHFLRAYVTMPGETKSHAIRIYFSPATRLNKFFIDQQLVPRTSPAGVAGKMMAELSATKSENGEPGIIALVASHPKNGNFYFATATRAHFVDPTLPVGTLNNGFRFQLFQVTPNGETKKIIIDSKRVFPDQKPTIELSTPEGKLSFPNPNFKNGQVTLGNVTLLRQRREGAQ